LRLSGEYHLNETRHRQTDTDTGVEKYEESPTSSENFVNFGAFLNAGKSVGARIKNSITFPFFNGITFHLAV